MMGDALEFYFRHPKRKDGVKTTQIILVVKIKKKISLRFT